MGPAVAIRELIKRGSSQNNRSLTVYTYTIYTYTYMASLEHQWVEPVRGALITFLVIRSMTFEPVYLTRCPFANPIYEDQKASSMPIFRFLSYRPKHAC